MKSLNAFMETTSMSFKNEFRIWMMYGLFTQKFNYNQYENKNFRKHLAKEYENEIFTNKEKEKQSVIIN
jgi:hypothetical protein